MKDEEDDGSGDDIEDEEDDSEQDNAEAFNDIEDEDILCSNYIPGERMKKLPDAVVIGARKGGTRALLEFLNMHSRIRRAKAETHYYDDEANFKKGQAWYIDQMPLLLPGQIGMEKTPGYFHTNGVPERMWRANNKTKLVLIVRNPVDRLISDYNQFRSRNLEKGKSYPPLEDLIFKEENVIDTSYPPLRRSDYAYHLIRWITVFPLEQIHVVDGDKFIKEPWTQIGELEKFLDIPPEITEDNFFFNKTKGFYCGQEKLTLPHSQWECTRKKCLNKSKGRPKAKVKEETYSILRKFYASRNDLFYSLVGQNFGWPTD